MELKCNALTTELYIHFHELVGFIEYSPEDVALALDKTLYSVVAYKDQRPVGIARVVGDGRIVFFIKDVIVDPQYQNCSVGRAIMEAVMAYIRRSGCPMAHVCLMSTPGKEGFYERFGFVGRPSDGLGAGMVQYLHPHTVTVPYGIDKDGR